MQLWESGYTRLVLDSSNFWTARVPATLLIAVITPEVVHVPHPSLQPTHAHNQFVFIYLFNLHIGIGLLALPKAFSEAGMVLGSILLIILAFVGYMTATYMIEAMAAANAYVKLEQREKKESSENESSSDAQKVNQVHVRIYSSSQWYTILSHTPYGSWKSESSPRRD